MTHYRDKIKSIADLAVIVEERRMEGKKIVHCHGVFDLLHIGHIRYFEQARKMGDVLIVTLTPDRFVDKGPTRPAFRQTLRAEALASLHLTDYVAINEWPTAEETIRLLKPNYYVKGSEFKNVASDMTGKVGREKAVADEVGTKLVFTEDIVFSSSNLINRYFSAFPQELQEYFSLMGRRFGLDHLSEVLDKTADLNVTCLRGCHHRRLPLLRGDREILQRPCARAKISVE